MTTRTLQRHTVSTRSTSHQISHKNLLVNSEEPCSVSPVPTMRLLDQLKVCLCSSPNTGGHVTASRQCDEKGRKEVCVYLCVFCMYMHENVHVCTNVCVTVWHI